MAGWSRGRGLVRRARDRAQQRRPLAALTVRAGGGIRARGQQQPRDLGQPAGPGRIQPVPPGGARRVQGGPPRLLISADGQPGFAGQHFPDPCRVAEDHGGAEVVSGDPRITGQHAGRLSGPVTDAGDQEFLHLLVTLRGARLNLGREPGPARVAVLAGDGQLGGG